MTAVFRCLDIQVGGIIRHLLNLSKSPLTNSLIDEEASIAINEKEFPVSRQHQVNERKSDCYHFIESEVRTIINVHVDF